MLPEAGLPSERFSRLFSQNKNCSFCRVSRATRLSTSFPVKCRTRRELMEASGVTEEIRFPDKSSVVSCVSPASAEMSAMELFRRERCVKFTAASNPVRSDIFFPDRSSVVSDFILSVVMLPVPSAAVRADLRLASFTVTVPAAADGNSRLPANSNTASSTPSRRCVCLGFIPSPSFR